MELGIIIILFSTLSFPGHFFDILPRILFVGFWEKERRAQVNPSYLYSPTPTMPCLVGLLQTTRTRESFFRSARLYESWILPLAIQFFPVKLIRLQLRAYV